MNDKVPFIAVDGEACEGDYVLLNRSDAVPLADLARGGLHTVACLEYLLNASKPANVVCFGLGYDSNNWLRDLPRHSLELLWRNKVVYWRDYRIEFMPKRWLSVKALDGRFVKVTEVWGFFQSSFVRALEAWGIGAPAEIERMKAQRGSFERSEIAGVARYCRHECELLVELMEAVRAACREAAVMPASWIGAGAIAMALLNRQGVKEHHRYDLDLSSEHVAREVICGAYFGGRVELLRQGVHHNVAAADLISAYPAAMRELPSLKGAKLRKRKRFNPERPGVWHVRWDLRGQDRGVSGSGTCQGERHPPLLAPFPVRHKFSIFYPLAGAGHYHTVEVANAIELGYPVEVLDGWALEGPHISERPFSWVPQVYAARQRFKREGRAAEKMVKLGLNSVYGKLAQGYGHNTRPKYQSYFWAGMVTAATRAAVLRTALGATNPIMIATDGIYAESFGRLGPSSGLGNWERGEADELFAAQPGVYEAVKDGVALQKSRGFFAREIDYGQLREGWEAEGSDYVHHYESTRFQGLGSSLARKDFSVWRKWLTERRSILLWPERKLAGPEGVLLPFPGRLESEPYKPKVSLIDQRAIEDMEGADQPMVVVI